MRLFDLIFLTFLFLIFSSIDTKINLFLSDYYIASNLTYLFFCYLSLRNPQQINSYFGAYIGFLIDLHQNVFFGLNASLFTLTILVINYNYFRLKMFSTLQTTIAFSFFASFFVGFKGIFLSTMSFQYLVIFLSFFFAFISYLFVLALGKFLIKKTRL